MSSALKRRMALLSLSKTGGSGRRQYQQLAGASRGAWAVRFDLADERQLSLDLLCVSHPPALDVAL